MKKIAPVVLAVASVLLVAGCGGSNDSAKQPSTKPLVVPVTFKNGTVEPQGKRVDVNVDQPVILGVTADAPGEIHVHSSPEQELEYTAGESDVELDPIDKPGLVEVESHTLDKQILELEVR